ncbi:hypothetical protein IWQ62_005546 [Dispira parvispora]|uniref:DUF4211 domain-containing protein n=1 Tax=Dispira parvispora TaxID=1520584 RepID=A0A9W8AQQ8_9FUNG|nr:hypothetical protein IWQ62_005546 [Dispira parvispora]
MASKQKQLNLRSFLVTKRTPASAHATSSTPTSVTTPSLEGITTTDKKHSDRPCTKAKFSIDLTWNPTPSSPKSTRLETRRSATKTTRRSKPTLDHKGLADRANDTDEEDESVVDIRQELDDLDTSAIISKRHRSRREAPISRIKQHLQRTKRPLSTEDSDQDESLLSGMASASPRKRATASFRNRHIVPDSDSDSDSDVQKESPRDSTGCMGARSLAQPTEGIEDGIESQSTHGTQMSRMESIECTPLEMDDDLDDFIDYDEPLTDITTLHSTVTTDDHRHQPEPSLPAELSANTSQSVPVNIKILIQYIVHLVVHGEVVDQLDETQQRYFESAYRAVDRKVQGVKESLVYSSAWRPSFQESLRRYPHYSSHENLFPSECQGCHFSNRRASSDVRLNGPSYDTGSLASAVRAALSSYHPWKSIQKESKDKLVNYLLWCGIQKRLEAVLNPLDTDRVDPLSEEPPSEYSLGCHCHTRSVLYHKMHHFMFRLCNSILLMIKSALVPLKLVDSSPEDAPALETLVEHAEAIVDWLETSNTMYTTWSNYEQLMIEAEKYANVNGND